jgi:hypothetical protein
MSHGERGHDGDGVSVSNGAVAAADVSSGGCKIHLWAIH